MWSRRLFASALVAATALGCRQILGLDDRTFDASGMNCPSVGTECVGAQRLRTCESLASPATETTCSWGCLATGSAHCGRLVPTGGGVDLTDLDPNAALGATMIVASTVLDSDTGSITGVRDAGSGVKNGIEYLQRNNIAIFKFGTLTVNATLSLQGSIPVALVATDEIVVQSTVDARGDCLAGKVGPGGGFLSDGSGAGTSGGFNNGGGGGGYGAFGGSGGSGTASGGAGGVAFGMSEIAVLAGGGRGGGGTAPGGTGGGAIQLAANRRVFVRGGINAGGCGGLAGSKGGGGGGGGAGGVILIEAAQVELSGAILAANGGGGGGGGITARRGEDGRLATTQAAGGTSSGGGSGGSGGSRGVVSGAEGLGGTYGGGGGGGCGRIRIETADGQVLMPSPATFSPGVTDALASFGIATVQ